MDPEKLQETIRALGAQLTDVKERLDAATAKVSTESTRAEVAEGRALGLESRVAELQASLTAGTIAIEGDAIKREKERADTAEGKVARFDSTLTGMVRARAKLEREASAVMGHGFRMDDLADRDVMVAVVKRLDTSADVSTAVPDGIITGRFMSLIDGFMKNAGAQARVADILGGQNEAPRVDTVEAKRRSVRDQWKQPLPNDIRARKDA
jgi:hypothetical protein